MKILLVTPVNPFLSQGRPLPRYQPQNFWRRAMKKLGHQVAVFNLSQPPGFKSLTSLKFRRLISSFKPDEIFFSGGKDAVNKISGTVFFTGVASKTLSKTERQIGILSRLVVTNDPEHIKIWHDLGAKKTICLPISAIDKDMFPNKKIVRDIQVSFVGTMFADRQRYLAKITDKVPQFKIWGWIPPKTKLLTKLKEAYQGVAWEDKVVNIYQRSLIGLNFTPDHLSVCGNLRAFEIPASGAMLLTDKLNSQWFLPQKEAVEFTTPEQAVSKINYYLKNISKLTKIAKAGQKRTLSDHTYVERFKKLVSY